MPDETRVRWQECRRPQCPDEAEAFRAAGFWRDTTMLDDFLAHAAAQPDKAALTTYRHGDPTPVVLTYRQLADAVERIARGLVALGVRRDDVVSIQLPNGWEFAATTLAAMRVGAVVNPLVAIFRRRELEFMLARARSKVLVVPESFRGFSHAGLAAELVAALPELDTAVVLGDATASGAVSFTDFFFRTDHPAPDDYAERHRGPDEIATLMYTSGTTGEPKGTLHTANTLWSAGRPLFDSLRLDATAVGFMASTMGHLTGFLWGMLQPLALGMTMVYQEIWTPEQFVEIVGTDRVMWTLGATPFVVDSVAAQRADPRDLSSFRYFVCAGAPIPSSLPAEATEVLGAKLMALWGTSECGICTIHTPEDPIGEISSSDGRRTPLMSVRLADELGGPVPDGQPGRLLTKGPSMFVGYLDRMDLYDAVVDADGWFDTGDLGYQTPSGGIRISGRAKDIIIRGGENIPVVEIESVLFTHPKVREVAVVGYPDPRLVERACAVVVPEGAAPTLDELRDYLDGTGMARQYWPERLDVRPELPHTPSGKIQKFKLRDELGGSVFEAPR